MPQKEGLQGGNRALQDFSKIDFITDWKSDDSKYPLQGAEIHLQTAYREIIFNFTRILINTIKS